ncbi:hypothetical protein [Accumulibacter sp.]|uniref:hypothetical protein n=1 Tax=Accumulibacter sp. TaxID=2053492 RepID=UPI00257A8997|nr:hypothetical protein [Accumulibacter sp.]
MPAAVSAYPMRLAAHLLLLAALALLGIKVTFDDHESSGLLAGLGSFLYGLFFATYLVIACSGYVVARRRSGAWLLTAHVLAVVGGMAVAAGTFHWLASKDQAGAGATRTMIESPGRAPAYRPQESGRRALAGAGTAREKAPLQAEDAPAIRRGGLPHKADQQGATRDLQPVR